MNFEQAMARTDLWLLIGLTAQIRMATTESPITFGFAMGALAVSALALFFMGYPVRVGSRGR